MDDDAVSQHPKRQLPFCRLCGPHQFDHWLAATADNNLLARFHDFQEL
jgi:hypothetical protein